MGSTEKRLRKFDNGNRTPQQYHEQFAFPPHARCSGCGHRPSIRAIVLYPAAECVKANLVPPLELVDWNSPVGKAITGAIVHINEGGADKIYMRLPIIYSCKGCSSAMEKMLAKDVPSWAIVEINRGPDPTERVLVGVG